MEVNAHETLQVAAAGQLQPRFNTPTGLCETEADDGKHASSVIEVDLSPQGQEEREVWRERARPRVWEHADLQA